MSEKRALESQTKNQWLVQQRRRRRPRPRQRPPQWQQQGQQITLLRSSLSISAFYHDPSFPPTPCFRALPAWMGESLGVQKKLGRTKTLYQYQSQVLQQSQLKPLNGSIQKAIKAPNSQHFTRIKPQFVEWENVTVRAPLMYITH